MYGAALASIHAFYSLAVTARPGTGQSCITLPHLPNLVSPFLFLPLLRSSLHSLFLSLSLSFPLSPSISYLIYLST